MDAWRLEVPIDAPPPSSSGIEGECLSVPRLLPPRDISRHYNRICKTHKKLVKRGEIKCSVSLSESPEVSNQEEPSLIDQSVQYLPSAPDSPFPNLGHTIGSVHWGAVGEFSGVSTPVQTPQRHSVIVKNTSEINFC